MNALKLYFENSRTQKARMIKKICNAIGGNKAGNTIAVLDLTFKPETDVYETPPLLANFLL